MVPGYECFSTMTLVTCTPVPIEQQLRMLSLPENSQDLAATLLHHLR